MVSLGKGSVEDLDVMPLEFTPLIGLGLDLSNEFRKYVPLIYFSRTYLGKLCIENDVIVADFYTVMGGFGEKAETVARGVEANHPDFLEKMEHLRRSVLPLRCPMSCVQTRSFVRYKYKQSHSQLQSLHRITRKCRRTKSGYQS